MTDKPDIATARKEPDACPLQVPEKAEPVCPGDWVDRYLEGAGRPAMPAEVAEAEKAHVVAEYAAARERVAPLVALERAAEQTAPSPPDAVAELRAEFDVHKRNSGDFYQRTVVRLDELEHRVGVLRRSDAFQTQEKLDALEKQLRELTGKAIGLCDRATGTFGSCGLPKGHDGKCSRINWQQRAEAAEAERDKLERKLAALEHIEAIYTELVAQIDGEGTIDPHHDTSDRGWCSSLLDVAELRAERDKLAAELARHGHATPGIERLRAKASSAAADAVAKLIATLPRGAQLMQIDELRRIERELREGAKP